MPGTVRELRPAPTADNTAVLSDSRITKYLEPVSRIIDRDVLAREGSYYTVTNPTVDTTVACGIIAAYAATTPLFHIVNTDASRTITLDYIKLRVTIAPASGTSTKFVIDVDNSLRNSTAPTGGVSRTVNNLNPAVSNDFNGQFWAFTGGTVLTIMAASASRTVANGTISHSIPLVLDELMLVFGQNSAPAGPATAVTRRIGYAPPVVVPPGASASIFIYFPSNAATGLSAEYEAGLWQR